MAIPLLKAELRPVLSRKKMKLESQGHGEPPRVALMAGCWDSLDFHRRFCLTSRMQGPPKGLGLRLSCKQDQMNRPLLLWHGLY